MKTILRALVIVAVGALVCALAPRVLAASDVESSVAAPNRFPGKPLTFQFGTPNSASRPGFTKVTVQDLYTVERGYGFVTTEGLLAMDRVIAEQTGAVRTDALNGVFETAKLRPGIYTLQATLDALRGIEPSAKCQVLVVPPIFDRWMK